MATTDKQVTKEWSQISEGNCTIQTNFYGIRYDVAVGSQDGSYISVKLDEPTTFAFDAPIFCRLPERCDRELENITVIE